MEEKRSSRPPGRPRVYAEREGQEGAPTLSLRLDPYAHEHIKTRAEGARAYIERLVSDDRELHGDQDANAEGRLNLHYWRVGFKGSEQPVLSLSEFGEDKTRLSYVETITHGYWIDAERLKNAEWIITWMCQLDEKSWVTAQSLREFFKIMRAFDLAHHYY